jgi:hypothetical protein
MIRVETVASGKTAADHGLRRENAARSNEESSDGDDHADHEVGQHAQHGNERAAVTAERPSSSCHTKDP